MNLANWTTRFLVGNAQDSDKQPDGQSSESGSAVRQVASAQPAASRSLVGSRVGTYPITKRLGEGGVGEVFKGVDVMLKREVAIKVLHPEFACDPLFVKRFSREAQLHAQLSHPNIATVHALLHEEGDKQFMVMEYVAGISLDEFVRSGGPVPVSRALSIFRRALDGIEHAHRNGIVHRDIKPANIMVADSGAVKVMDFGIARALDCREQLTRHGQVAGTAKAMSPEQIRGAQADVRSDIYSLGHRAVHVAGRPGTVRCRQRPRVDEGPAGTGTAAAAPARRRRAAGGGGRGDEGAPEGPVRPLPDRGRVFACARCQRRRRRDDGGDATAVGRAAGRANDVENGRESRAGPWARTAARRCGTPDKEGLC